MERAGRAGRGGPSVRLTVDLQLDFALNQPLSPFALAAFELLDPESPSYALDVVSVVEATLDDPRQILSAQQNKARGEAVAAMKADGIEYEERMELLEEVTYPKPLEELLGAAYDVYRQGHPWVGDYQLSPKSVVRDMYERAMTFVEYVSYYGWPAPRASCCATSPTPTRRCGRPCPTRPRPRTSQDLIEWLGELVRQVDSSLLDEWEQLRHPDEVERAEAARRSCPTAPPPVTSNARAFRVLVRNEMFRRVELAALEKLRRARRARRRSGWDADALGGRAGRLLRRARRDRHRAGRARPGLLLIERGAGTSWRVRQIFDDPAGDHDWGISAEVDLAASDEAGTAVVRVTDVNEL